MEKPKGGIFGRRLQRRASNSAQSLVSLNSITRTTSAADEFNGGSISPSPTLMRSGPPACRCSNRPLLFFEPCLFFELCLAAPATVEGAPMHLMWSSPLPSSCALADTATVPISTAPRNAVRCVRMRPLTWHVRACHPQL